MVSKETIKGLEFSDIVDYYEYVADSILNGQKTQATRLINEMSNNQKKEAINYFKDRIKLFDKESHFNQALELTLKLI